MIKVQPFSNSVVALGWYRKRGRLKVILLLILYFCVKLEKAGGEGKRGMRRATVELQLGNCRSNIFWFTMGMAAFHRKQAKSILTLSDV